ncbi:thiamine pyrophosphate-binding protein [Novipirellula sp. SH528]|uniref:thiamine pyrophosphate-binding protein n=1 Tax=Novipirellula sp. SH528 TaxID=3454466 RepID=UPI003FA181D9
MICDNRFPKHATLLHKATFTPLFGYPGGANLEIFDVLHEFGIRCIRTEHEQGAVHAAQGLCPCVRKGRRLPSNVPDPKTRVSQSDQSNACRP